MNRYQKSISYLDYLENGMKISNAGFVRIEEKSGQIRLEIQMKNLPEEFSGQFELHADCGGVVGRISLNRGNGSCCIVWNDQALNGRKKVEAGGIYLRLPGRRLVQTVWPNAMWIPVEEEEISSEPDLQKMQIQPEQQMQPVPESQPSKQQEIPDRPEKQMQPVPESQPSKQQEIPDRPQQQEMTKQLERQMQPIPEDQPQKQQEQLYGDKWEQLTHMYPLVHPFGDERAYLSIEPKDFVVLCRDYQKMVHNSFLLHGFYNYHHLLLGKIFEKGEWYYYLGVPGNFYTREKMVAEMFGFEAFEGEKNPASPGDFGYYMKRVDI